MLKVKKEDSRKIFVFVYGTLKRGYGNNRLLTNAKYINEAETLEKMEMKSGFGFPFVSDKNKVSTIKGELYLVNPIELERLDRLEGYNKNRENNFYNRKKIKVKINNQIVDSWIYLCDRGDGKVLTSGKWERYL